MGLAVTGLENRGRVSAIPNVHAVRDTRRRLNRSAFSVSPLLGWKTGSVRSAPPALRPGAPICERISPSLSCDVRAAVMASLEIATI